MVMSSRCILLKHYSNYGTFQDLDVFAGSAFSVRGSVACICPLADESILQCRKVLAAASFLLSELTENFVGTLREYARSF